MTCLFFVSEHAVAARHYLVELVVFSNQGTQSDESWTNIYPPLSKEKMQRARLPSDITPQAVPATAEIMELAESRFKAYVARLRKDNSKKILVNERWVQEVKDPDNTTIAHITDSQASDLAASAADRGTGSGVNKRFTAISPADAPSAGVPPVLDGFVNFFLDGYYALETDLRYTPPYRPSILEDNQHNGPATYRIHEQRKMKSGELNYYDHPQFGMVLLVTPVQSLDDKPDGGDEQAGEPKREPL